MILTTCCLAASVLLLISHCVPCLNLLLIEWPTMQVAHSKSKHLNTPSDWNAFALILFEIDALTTFNIQISVSTKIINCWIVFHLRIFARFHEFLKTLLQKSLCVILKVYSPFYSKLAPLVKLPSEPLKALFLEK